MSAIAESVEVLSARLPELSWRLRSLFSDIDPSLLPRGLFSHRSEFTPQTCIDDVSRDLAYLKKEKNEQVGQYIADRVNQKINVLVRLCLMPKGRQSAHNSPLLSLDSISTRSQWLRILEEDVVRLQGQAHALQSRLEYWQNNSITQEALLKIKSELGEVEQCLTLAREALARESAADLR